VVTKPDLSFIVSQIRQFMHALRTSHLDVINIILRYLKGSPEKKIGMRKNILIQYMTIPIQTRSEASTENRQLIFAHL
jgi:hypothetical protein